MGDNRAMTVGVWTRPRTLSIAGEGDDLGSGFLWFLIFVPLASRLISASLGITAAFVQRKVSFRRFAWPKALLRSAIALPMSN